MKIVHVCDDFVAPARDHQGTQRVIEALVKGQRKLGHDVSLLIHPDSKTDIAPLLTKMPDDVEIAHYHGGSPEMNNHPNVKHWVATIHGGTPPNPDEHAYTQKYLQHMIAISKSASIVRGALAYVHNSVDNTELIYKEQKSDYFLWIGGTDWEEQKGLFSTIAFARRMNFKLKIAGTGTNQNIINQIKYFAHGNIEYLGSVNGKEKAELVANAKGLFMIGRISDGCPLTTIEALFSGTPVIARDLPIHNEMLTNEVGFICKTDSEIAKAVYNIESKRSDSCRAHAIKLFNYESQAGKYIDLYRHVIETGTVA